LAWYDHSQDGATEKSYGVVEKDYYPHVYFGCYEYTEDGSDWKWKDCIIFIGADWKVRIGRKSQVVRKMDSDAPITFGWAQRAG